MFLRSFQYCTWQEQEGLCCLLYMLPKNKVSYDRRLFSIRFQKFWAVLCINRQICLQYRLLLALRRTLRKNVIWKKWKNVNIAEGFYKTTDWKPLQALNGAWPKDSFSNRGDSSIHNRKIHVQEIDDSKKCNGFKTDGAVFTKGVHDLASQKLFFDNRSSNANSYKTYSSFENGCICTTTFIFDVLNIMTKNRC